MRMITILAAGTAVAMVMAAKAESPSTQQAPSRPTVTVPRAPTAAPTIQSVIVVDMPATTQSQVNEIVAKRGEYELGKLRDTIEATPTIRSALEAKGLCSRNVIIAQMNPDGALTLVTRKSG